MAERLQKLIAEAGIASRRHAEEMIAAGEVSVNGEIVREPGTKADPKVDNIKVRGRLINPLLEKREKVHVLLYKPRGYLSSVADPEGRPLVTELVPPSLGRLHPVGRLDFNTEGLLILTNDGALTNYVTAARNKVPKVYEAKVKGSPPESSVERLRRGITLEEDGRSVRTAPATISTLRGSDFNTWYEVILREGRNQQIRRMFDAIGHSVVKLRRVRIGDVTDKGMNVGAWRLLSPAEVRSLMGAIPKARQTKAPRTSKSNAQRGSKTPDKGRPRSSSLTQSDEERGRESKRPSAPPVGASRPRTTSAASPRKPRG